MDSSRTAYGSSVTLRINGVEVTGTPAELAEYVQRQAGMVRITARQHLPAPLHPNRAQRRAAARRRR